MAIQTLNDIRGGTCVIFNGEPYIVVTAKFVRMQQRKPVMQTKMKNLINGKVLEYNFKQGEKVEEANLERSKANYLYKDADQAYLMDNTSFEQFNINIDLLGQKASFLKDGEDVDVLYFNQKPVNIDLPAKVVLKVTEAPPGVKGDSAQGATKQITLETGLIINAPLFIKEGDEVRINTETGDYVERA